MVVLLHATLGDPDSSGAVRAHLAQEMQRRGLPMDLEEDGLVETAGRTPVGWVDRADRAARHVPLFWHAGGRPGRGRRGCSARSSSGCGSARCSRAAALAIAASLLTERPLVDDLARLFMGALMIVGLAAATASRRRGG